MDVQAAKKYVAVIERALVLLKAAVEDGKTPDVDIPVEPQPVVAPAISHEQLAARNKHIQALMEIDCWPLAVPAHHMNSNMSDEDQINRANAVLDMTLMKSVEGKHFLDFGCGDGWIAREAIKRGAATSTGYDLQTFPTWPNPKMKGVGFVTDFSVLTKEKFDVIFLYDVLDHTTDPIGVMNQVKMLLNTDGVVYVRCHPWSSKHASHLYKKGLNKAYIHLFLTWDELAKLGYEPMFTRTEKKPLEAYRWWFNNFKIERERPIREAVSDFFYVPSFMDLVTVEQQLAPDVRESFFKNMDIQFVDYVLKL